MFLESTVDAELATEIEQGVKQTVSHKAPRSHMIIPDCQVRPGVPLEHLTWIGNYAAAKRPEVIVQIGDFSDIESLSSYTVGKAEAEGKRYAEDIRVTHEAMRMLMAPIKKVKGYKPQLILTLGNHEARCDREAESNPKLQGLISSKDLGYERFGWDVRPFLEIAEVDGIAYTHYFTSGPKGLPVASAKAILNTRHSSGVMGHKQECDIAFHQKSGHFAIISGCCYLHEEKYLGPQMTGKAQRRQIVMLHEVRDGIADPMLVSLEFLRRRYS